MNLAMLTSGSPNTKPWLNIQCRSLLSNSLDAQTVHSTSEETTLLIMDQTDILPRPDVGTTIVTADTIGRVNIDTSAGREVVAYLSDLVVGSLDEIKSPDGTAVVKCADLGSSITTTRSGIPVQIFDSLQSLMTSPGQTSELDLREIGGGYLSLNQNGRRRVLVEPTETAVLGPNSQGRILVQDDFVMVDQSGDPYFVGDFVGKQCVLGKPTTVLDHQVEYSCASQCLPFPFPVGGIIPSPIIQPGHSGSWKFPPNEMTPDSCYQVSVAGYFSGFAPAQTVRFQLLCNGETIMDTGFQPTAISTTFRTVMIFGVDSPTQTWCTAENRFQSQQTMEYHTCVTFDITAINDFTLLCNLGINNADLIYIRRIMFTKIAG